MSIIEGQKINNTFFISINNPKSKNSMVLGFHSQLQSKIDEAENSKEINSFLLKHKDFICNETQSINLITTDNIDMPSIMDIDIASNELALTEVKFKIKKV